MSYSTGIRPKIDITDAELLRMRNESKLNNVDIAEALGCSYTFVVRRIGRCPKEITGYMSLDDYEKKHGIGKYSTSSTSHPNQYTKGTKQTRKSTNSRSSNMPKLPTYIPNIENEIYKIEMGDATIQINADYKDNQLVLEQEGSGVFIPYDNMMDVFQFLTWFIREKLETRHKDSSES